MTVVFTRTPGFARRAQNALGRLPTGVMNKTESAYASHLDLRKLDGDILWYRFEGIKLRLADNTFLTVDFALMRHDGTLELHDVKGGPIRDDANVKLKVAADQYPFVFYIVRKAKIGWAMTPVSNRVQSTAKDHAETV